MQPEEAKELLVRVQQGVISVDEAMLALRRLPIEDLGFARLDVHRELRQGMPEAIYAEGKETHQTVAIARRTMERTTGPVIATRVPPATAEALLEAFPDALHHAVARLVILRADAGQEPRGLLVVVNAGTSDLPVSEEAAVVAEAMGIKVERMNDVGVAGLHRVLEAQDALHEADVVVVVAGMEGALASIVGGLTSAPVVAVPTSVGYGASFDGLAALLGMLTSCAAGIVVCNIDNGFGAAMFALKLLRKRSQ